jgi:sialate O-acetylesterase
MMMKIALLGLISLLLSSVTFAADPLGVAAIFADGMVLQRQMDVPVWGTAQPGDTVQVKFGGQEKTATADEAGKWMVKLDPLKASADGRTMRITSQVSGLSFQASDILVGEVWLCAGQSNMDWTLKKLVAKPGGAEEDEAYQYLLNEVATANDPLLRQFTVGAAATPLKELEVIQTRSGWTRAVKGKVDDFSGTGYFFGRELRAELGVPIGLIDANRGGTDIEPWIPKRAYLKTTEGKAFYEKETAKLAPAAMQAQKAAYQKQLAEWKQQTAAAKAAKTRAPRKPADPINANRVPAALYNGSIHALAPYAIKGTIWYQGENNTVHRTKQYRDSMLQLVNGWRAHWGQDTFHFFWCQLANKNTANTKPNDGDAWVQIQNQQREVLALTDDTGMAVLNDIGAARNIHPKNKVDVGKRLTLLALNKAYGNDVVCSGPLYQSSRIEGNKVVITFEHAGSGLIVGTKAGLASAQPVDEPLSRFQICGQDKQWHWAEAKITGQDTVEVWHPDIPAPVEVRYAWSSNPEGSNLYNKEGLPASLFKTK